MVLIGRSGGPSWVCQLKHWEGSGVVWEDGCDAKCAGKGEAEDGGEEKEKEEEDSLVGWFLNVLVYY